MGGRGRPGGQGRGPAPGRGTLTWPRTARMTPDPPDPGGWRRARRRENRWPTGTPGRRGPGRDCCSSPSGRPNRWDGSGAGRPRGNPWLRSPRDASARSRNHPRSSCPPRRAWPPGSAGRTRTTTSRGRGGVLRGSGIPGWRRCIPSGRNAPWPVRWGAS